jgi:site-specific DNA-methyltransferase (adenine-specific)
MNIDTTETTQTTAPAIGYIPGYVQPFFSFYNADNMAIMKTFKDKEFDLAIVDPPYGIGIDGQKQSINNKNPKANRKAHNFKGWDNSIPSAEYFAELWRISKNQIIWGANYFVEHINKPTKGWVVWYKGQEGLTMSDAELAFSSFNSATRVIKINRVELLKEGTIHPTQKPIKLYEWLLNNYANENDKIIDTHLGSGSIAIAIDKANTLDKKNLTFVGIELDPYYFRAAVERFKNHKRQCVLF